MNKDNEIPSFSSWKKQLRPKAISVFIHKIFGKCMGLCWGLNLKWPLKVQMLKALGEAIWS
jgi:hypothetical protein